MKLGIPALAVALLASGFGPPTLVAQGPYPNVEVPGSFDGPGLFITRGGRLGTFGYQAPSVRNGMVGTFGYQPPGPWFVRGEPSPLPVQQFPLLPAANFIGWRDAAAPQTPVAVYSRTELPFSPIEPSQEANGLEGQTPVEPALNAPGRVQRSAVARVVVVQNESGEASVSAGCARPAARSPELSDRLTRIARTREMLAGQGIDVYLCGGVAVLQGSVRTTGNRLLLANVVGLEPEVNRVDNRLVVEQPR